MLSLYHLDTSLSSTRLTTQYWAVSEKSESIKDIEKKGKNKNEWKIEVQH